MIKLLMAAGWFTLPLTHLKWLPELGTTRPLSGVIFAAAFGLIVLAEIFQGSRRLPDMLGWSFFNRHLRGIPGWRFLRWWAILILLGIVSADITPLYGNFFQALNRLLGYALIFIYIYCGLYSLERFGIETVARWTAIGYLPILAYAVVEVLAILHFYWAAAAVAFVRGWIVTPFPWVNRLSLLATEPSFVSFQMLLLAALFPWLKSNFLRFTSLALILLSAIFATSGTYLLILAAYVVGLALFSMRRKVLIGATAAGGITALSLGALLAVSPPFQRAASAALQVVFFGRSIDFLFGSLAIRYNYVKTLIYAILETHGLGLGIGQYGMFWKDIFLRHIDYKPFDQMGEVTSALNSPEYMRPWSVIFGIGADLGVVGMGLFFAFVYQILAACSSPHARAIVVAGLVALLGAYPIVTPHVWLALALVGGYGLQLKTVQAPA